MAATTDLKVRHIAEPLAAYLLACLLGAFAAWWSQDLVKALDVQRLVDTLGVLAGVVATIAGFIAAGAVFLGGASAGGAIEMRNAIGIRLPVRMSMAIVVLFTAAISIAVSALWAPSPVATGVALSALAIAVMETSLVALGIAAAYGAALRHKPPIKPVFDD